MGAACGLYHWAWAEWQSSQGVLENLPNGVRAPCTNTPGVRFANTFFGECASSKDEFRYEGDNELWGRKVYWTGCSATSRLVTGLLLDLLVSVTCIMLARMHQRLGISHVIRTVLNVIGWTYVFVPTCALPVYCCCRRGATWAPKVMTEDQPPFFNCCPCCAPC